MINKGAINNNLTRGNKKEIITWGIPDYTSPVALTIAYPLEYTAIDDGFVTIGHTGHNSRTGDIKVSINETEVFYVGGRSNITMLQEVSFTVKKGDIIKAVATNVSFQYCNFYPCLGV